MSGMEQEGEQEQEPLGTVTEETPLSPTMKLLPCWTLLFPKAPAPWTSVKPRRWRYPGPSASPNTGAKALEPKDHPKDPNRSLLLAEQEESALLLQGMQEQLNRMELWAMQAEAELEAHLRNQLAWDMKDQAAQNEEWALECARAEQGLVGVGLSSGEGMHETQ
uniref:Uncharacterized protein n=1 Tax=Sphaerodactylus townsendi TaxID=933632 RepID=A0ACB8EF40_9SAUR